MYTFFRVSPHHDFLLFHLLFSSSLFSFLSLFSPLFFSPLFSFLSSLFSSLLFSLSSFSLCLRVLVVCVSSCVFVWCCVVWCGVCRVVWHAENPVCRLKTLSVCRFKTSPCMPATRAHADTDTDTDLSNPKSTRAKMVHRRAGGRSGIHGKSLGAENRNRSSTSIRL